MAGIWPAVSLTTMAVLATRVRPLLVSSILIASFWPAICRSLDVDPAVHDMCASASDYVGCVKINSRYLDAGMSRNRRSRSGSAPQSATNDISPRDPNAFGEAPARGRGRRGVNGMMQSSDPMQVSPAFRSTGAQQPRDSAGRGVSKPSDFSRGGESSGPSSISSPGRSSSRQSAESSRFQNLSDRSTQGRSRTSRVGQAPSSDAEAPRSQTPSTSGASRRSRKDSSAARSAPQQPTLQDRSVQRSDISRPVSAQQSGTSTGFRSPTSATPSPQRVTRSDQSSTSSDRRSPRDSDSGSSPTRDLRGAGR